VVVSPASLARVAAHSGLVLLNNDVDAAEAEVLKQRFVRKIPAVLARSRVLACQLRSCRPARLAGAFGQR
jgi:hypothetical protein